MKAAIKAGTDLEGTRKKVDLSKFTEDFAQGDPVRQYRFQGWFINPNIAETFAVMKVQ